MHTLHEGLGFRPVHTPGTYAAVATKGTWHSMVGFRRALFVPFNGELDGNMTFKVFMATDASGTSATEVSTALRNTFTNGTDEGRIGLIEVLADELTVGYPYVTLEVTPTATDSFSSVVVLGEPYELPVDNGTGDGVAFADSIA